MHQYREDLLRSMTAFSRDEEASKDAVQQAYLKALLNLELVRPMPEKAFKAWLYATARNALIDGKRRQRRLVYDLPDALPSAESDPLDRLLVQCLLERLPEELAQVVRLKYYGGLNSTQIGEALDLPPATVRTRLRKAMNVMRTYL